MFEGGCSRNVDVVLIVEAAKGGEGGGLEDSRVLLHLTHLDREAALTYWFIPGIGNCEGGREGEGGKVEVKGGRRKEERDGKEKGGREGGSARMGERNFTDMSEYIRKRAPDSPICPGFSKQP